MNACHCGASLRGAHAEHGAVACTWLSSECDWHCTTLSQYRTKYTHEPHRNLNQAWLYAHCTLVQHTLQVMWRWYGQIKALLLSVPALICCSQKRSVQSLQHIHEWEIALTDCHAVTPIALAWAQVYTVSYESSHTDHTSLCETTPPLLKWHPPPFQKTLC